MSNNPKNEQSIMERIIHRMLEQLEANESYNKDILSNLQELATEGNLTNLVLVEEAIKDQIED